MVMVTEMDNEYRRTFNNYKIIIRLNADNKYWIIIFLWTVGKKEASGFG